MATSIPLSDLQSSPSAKFDKIGDAYKGKILSMDERQQTNPEGHALTWNNGDPRMLWVITIEQANGEAIALWAKGGNFAPVEGTGMSMLNAIVTAAKTAGATDLTVGDELAVAWTGSAKAEGGKNAAKLYTAQYRVMTRTATSVPVDLFADQ